MNTFFISPLIPFKFYVMIQKEKNNSSYNWTPNEIKFLNNINKLFDYDNFLTQEDKETLYSITDKIFDKVPEYKELKSKFYFIIQSSLNENTNYNYVYNNLLKQRNYKQIINPYSVDSINMCVGLSDTGPLVEVDVSKFKELKSDSEKFKYINKLIETKDDNIKNITHDILSKSYVDPKINNLTKILSNKSVLYNILEGENFIPISDTFETIDLINNPTNVENIINKFKQNIQSNYFVIKPAGGTLSDGVGIYEKDKLDLNFVETWIKNPNNNKHSLTGGYPSWILSEFIQSFLWKLEGQNLTSKVFSQLAEKEPKLKFNFDDKIGRINKFRFWTLYTIIDDEFTSYLYKDAYAEIALEELTNYSKTQLDPANIEEFYQNLLDVEEDNKIFAEIIKNNGPKNLEQEKIEALTVGTYLDFARVINDKTYPNGTNGTNGPNGQDAWNNIVMPNMYILVNNLASRIKKYMSCMNKFTLKGSKCCYSFFALDIIIDSNNKPWLLEINSRPFIGFDDYFRKYDPNNNHILNVNDVINGILGLTTDIVNGAGHKLVNYNQFLVTNIDKLNETQNKFYVPLSLGITDTATSKIYNELYNILDENNYSSFPYPRQMGKSVTKSIGFRGMSPISKFLISKIAKLGNDKFLSLMRELYPYDAKMKVLNRIVTLGFYLGDKAEMTKILKNKVKNWDSIIPYSDTINISELSDTQIIEKISNSPLETGKIIAKPAYGQQGKGIIISDNIQTLITEMRKNKEEKDFVISKYLDNPYLIKLKKQGVSGINYNDTYGRKCHLRAYVLIKKGTNTNTNTNKLSVYLYKESLIFCAAKEYNSCSNEKEYCNLTNLYFGSQYYKDVLNKNPNDAYKDLSGLAKDLIPQSEYPQLIKKIKHIIKTTILAVQDNLLCLNNNECYQYIAFDLHLEKSSSGSLEPIPWLLEVNATPGLKSPDYQWQNVGGVHNFLESILNITTNTKISKNGKQLFEYLPFNKKLTEYDKIDLPLKYYYEKYDEKYNKINDKINDYKNIEYTCADNLYVNIKKALQLLNIPGRSYLTTKKTMCEALSLINN